MPDIFDASKPIEPGEPKSVELEPEAEVEQQAEVEQPAETKHSAESKPESVPQPEPSADTPTRHKAPLIEKAKKLVSDVEQRLTPIDAVNKYSQVMRNEKPSNNPFDAFAPKPLTVYAFDSQLDNEQVLLLLRKHPITQLGKILVILIMLLLPLLFPAVDFYQAIPLRFRSAIVILWYLITSGVILEAFLTWYYNAYIVTDERIIDIDFLSLIYKNISAAKIDNIEDITATTGGALQSLVNFGTVKIQTAAANAEFEFEGVPHPNKVTQFLNELLLEEEKEKLEGRVR